MLGRKSWNFVAGGVKKEEKKENVDNFFFKKKYMVDLMQGL